MRLSVSKRAPHLSQAECLVVPVVALAASRQVWWPNPDEAWHRSVQSWMKRINFRANLHQTVLCPAPGRPEQTLILTGLGSLEALEPARIRQAVSAGMRQACRIKAAAVDVLLGPAHPLPWAAQQVVTFAVRGIQDGVFQLGEHPPAPAKAGLAEVSLVMPAPTAALRQRVATLAPLGPLVAGVRSLANEPCNRANPDRMVSFVQAMAKRTGLSAKIWGARALRRERCHALLAVGQGSRQEPRLIALKHRGDGRSKPVVLVGKTITFDSGGLSLKPAKSMEWMRYDKCGGMAVLAALEMVSRLNLKQPVVALLAVAENMPDGAAMRPGDVVTTRAGKTVEILNTDAEGRLVLADALDVARTYKPRCIVDLATLTGAAGVALGRPYSAIFGRPQSLVEELRTAGQLSGERVWPLPLHADYDGMLNSAFADLKNTGDGSAGAIAGAMFLQRFVAKDVPWCHIDLTQAWHEGGTAYAPAGANLFGAYLLVDWLTHLDAEK